MNTFGNIYRLTTFGESHGPAIGGIIDGVPAGEPIDLERISLELQRRRPGQSSLVSARHEPDSVEFLSGLFEGTTTGTPIGFAIRNTDARSDDYDDLRHAFRPSHADMTYTAKYGLRDHRGGGRASARETASRIVGGAIARQILERRGIAVHAYTSAIGPVSLDVPYSRLDLSTVYDSPVRCPDTAASSRMADFIARVRAAGDTVGGIATGVITGVPAGLGQPIFGKLQGCLAAAMMSIPAAKGFDYGLGFTDCRHLGSETIDLFDIAPDGSIVTRTNHSGGIQGGITNGADIYFRVAFKPVATLPREVATVTDDRRRITLKARGRHDSCVLPRAVPVVEAMASMVILDAFLANRSARL